MAALSAVTWDQLKDFPLALPIRSHTRMLVLSKLMERQISPQVAINAFSSQMLIRSVQDSQTVAVLPRIFYNASVKSGDPVVWLPMRELLAWNLEIRMKKRHRELNDTVCHIFDCIKEIDLSPELSGQSDCCL